MPYQLQEQYTSKNQVPGPDANSVWGLGARKVSSITIHHWGALGQDFNTVRDFLCTNNTPTSAHYVAEDSLVACIVSPDDCAFHAGNGEGNTNSVGIECRPEATDGDYETVAELIRFLRGLYGDIPLRPHNYWYSTACPGAWDLTRLDTLARSTVTAQGTITPEGFLMALTDAEQSEALTLLRYLSSPQFKVDQYQGTTDVEKAARKAFHKEGWDTSLPNVLTGGTTTPALEVSWNSKNVASLGNLIASAAAKAQPVTAQAAPVTVDVQALAAQLAPLLNSTTADQFVAALRTQLNKP